MEKQKIFEFDYWNPKKGFYISFVLKNEYLIIGLLFCQFNINFKR